MSDEILNGAQPEYVPEDADTEEAKKTLTYGLPWLPVIKRLSVNLFIPFINGIMLGFGEIFAHELGLIWGWRSAKVYDPAAYPATNPRARRKWLFGLV